MLTYPSIMELRASSTAARPILFRLFDCVIELASNPVINWEGRPPPSAGSSNHLPVLDNVIKLMLGWMPPWPWPLPRLLSNVLLRNCAGSLQPLFLRLTGISAVRALLTDSRLALSSDPVWCPSAPCELYTTAVLRGLRIPGAGKQGPASQSGSGRARLKLFRRVAHAASDLHWARRLRDAAFLRWVGERAARRGRTGGCSAGRGDFSPARRGGSLV